MWTVLPLLGAGVAWLLKSVAGWVASLPWAPFQGRSSSLDQLISTFGEPQATTGALAVGTVTGLVLALIAEQDRLTVAVSDDQVSMKRGESSLRSNAPSHAVFLDGKELVVLGQRSEELTREDSDLDADRLGTLFSSMGIPGCRAAIHTRMISALGGGLARSPIRRRRASQGSREGAGQGRARAKRTRRSCAPSSPGSVSWSATKESASSCAASEGPRPATYRADIAGRREVNFQEHGFLRSYWASCVLIPCARSSTPLVASE